MSWCCRTELLEPANRCDINLSSRMKPSTIIIHGILVTNIHTSWLEFIWLMLNGTVGSSGSGAEKCNQMSLLVIVFLWSAHGAVGRVPAGQTGRQRVVTSSTLMGEGSGRWILSWTEQRTRCREAKTSEPHWRDEWFPEQAAVTSSTDTWV